MLVVSAPSPPTSTENSGDLTRALEALDGQRPSTNQRTEPSAPATRNRVLRQVLITALTGLLVAGVIAVLQFRADETNGTANSVDSRSSGRATVVFGNAQNGNCLTWPDNAPDKPSFVLCRDDHLFEVAAAVDMSKFQEPCELTVRRYLGSHYDPDGKFTASVLWPGNGTGPQSTQRRLLCGLQLLGPTGESIPFKGKVADLDQSKVWSAGTCLSVDETTRRPTDIPVDCAGEHAAEVTGTVNLGERFPGPPPTQTDQEAFLRDACTQLTDAYLAPATLPGTGLSVHYSTVSPVSWSAGSRQVSCHIGAAGPDQGWATLTGSAKGQLAISGRSATPPPPPEPTATTRPAPTVAATAPPTTTAPASPTTTSSATPTATPSASPTTTSTSPATTPPPPLGPPPGPPSETTPPANVIEIPGLAPITLPVFPPPAPPPPPA
jgi:hypothetical protein